MSKKSELIEQLKPIIDNKNELEVFLIQNSNLPGPRSNLELAFAFADIYEDTGTVREWLKITEEKSGVNEPTSFLPFCAAVCLGSIYTKTKEQNIIEDLKILANDGRWRMREAVAFAFQTIGMGDFEELKKIFSEWIEHSNNLEKRAILVALAHPDFLTEERAQYCFEITSKVFQQMNLTDNFDVLKKGLEFTISVFVAANPKAGFEFIKDWIGYSKVVNKILKKNLQKNRLMKVAPKQVHLLIDQIDKSKVK